MITAIKTFFPQVLLIVFSVVLGLFLSNQIEKRAERKRADLIVENIKEEIEMNLKNLENWAPYHNKIRSSLDSLRGELTFIKEFESNAASLLKLATRGTLWGGEIYDSAWETAKLSPAISEVDYKDLSLISKVYRQQHGTFDPIGDISEILNSPFINSPERSEETLRLISRHLRELNGRETQLKKYYEQALENL